MSTAFMSWVGDWWARLFGRVDPFHASLLTPVANEPEPVRVPRRVEPEPKEPASAEPPDAPPADTAPPLIETLCLAKVPAPNTLTWTPDPVRREQTLAALADLQQIPALQSLAQGFLQAMSRPEVAVHEVVGAISKDSALCVRVLRMANSVLVSPERPIEDLDSAVQMLGIKRVRQAAHALFTLRDAHRVAEGFDWRHLWIHALATAAIAEEIEPHVRTVNDSQLHLAALLHDVGKIVLSTVAPDEYREVLVAAWQENGRLEDLERLRLGVDHREAGVLFARRSGLPAIAESAIAHHDRPEFATGHRVEVALVSLANYVSKAHGLGFSGARLDATDGEFADLSAWQVLTEECGVRPNIEGIEFQLGRFIPKLRSELRELRDSG